MAITASLVKELRERTGAGMMECKKALVECDGDIEAAADLMRKSGAAKADKKAGRVAADGAVSVKVSDDGKKAVIVEINSETDFVAKDDNFKAFATKVTETVFNTDPADVDALNATTTDDGQTIEQAREALIAKVGENIKVRRFKIITTENALVSYQHGARIGVLVESTADNEMGRDIAMHVAAVNPQCVSEADVPAESVEKEKGILIAQAESSGKPPEIIEKMIQGRLKKFLAEITLLGQPFVKDPDLTVAKLLKSANAEVNSFIRFEVGEGIEKKQEDFAAEVAAQMKG
ncbi:MAG: elongation factor Ts [Gammaproteobacteria bacterium]|nr:elongation factor Ts [Gammaproteobacteria bacterium]MBT3723829.1 elongation factor Ts [Gammaproteobacteria bacterium]MBT4078919.1 elongation factor Ts [Gammaproteobacteria bacterium]MBT4196377.1 elongation factor Ts [Gammaproteobacteria bacterium]MBT4448202.1 elongation factor Ts [Gammaproteobacteria bacterium]